MAIFDEKDFGIRLRTERKKAGLSQENLAYALNVTKSTISRFEKGITSPTPKQIAIMCNEMNINVNKLFDNSEKIVNKENSKNVFKTNMLYMYYKGIYPTTKKTAFLKFKLEIIEHSEIVEVNLLDFNTNKIYMTGYMLSDNDNTCDMIFENYKPNNNKYEVGIITVNISNNMDNLMLGVLRATNSQNIPNDRKCVISKNNIEFTNEIKELLKVTDAEKLNFCENDCWYIDITNKEDFEE